MGLERVTLLGTGYSLGVRRLSNPNPRFKDGARAHGPSPHTCRSTAKISQNQKVYSRGTMELG